jgi:hypothetical protein
VRRELGRRSSVACERVGEPCVQLLAFAGQDRCVDRLGEERVAEAEAPRRRVGDEHPVLDGLAERLAHVALGRCRGRAQQGVTDVAPDGRCDLEQAPGRSVEPVHTLQEQVTESNGQLAVPHVGGGEQLLGEEGVALGAVEDRVGQRG